VDFEEPVAFDRLRRESDALGASDFGPVLLFAANAY
jgi:hypothetical protein